MKTAVITGPHGFIASNLIRKLKREGIKCIELERYLLRNPVSLEAFFENHPFNYLFHTAAYGNNHDQTDEAEIIDVNIAGTWNLLQATKDVEYDAFVNFSTSAILLPRQTFYAASKMSAEALTLAFAQEYNKPCFSIRPSTVYGPGDKIHLIPQVIHSLLNKKKMEIVTSSKHDYIYIDDLIDAMLGLIDHASKIKGSSVNISSGKQHSNLEVINTLEKLTGKKLKYEKVDSIRRYDTESWNVDNSFLVEGIGWMPKYTLERGLKKLLVFETAFQVK